MYVFLVPFQSVSIMSCINYKQVTRSEVIKFTLLSRESPLMTSIFRDNINECLRATAGWVPWLPFRRLRQVLFFKQPANLRGGIINCQLVETSDGNQANSLVGLRWAKTRAVDAEASARLASQSVGVEANAQFRRTPVSGAMIWS